MSLTTTYGCRFKFFTRTAITTGGKLDISNRRRNLTRVFLHYLWSKEKNIRKTNDTLYVVYAYVSSIIAWPMPGRSSVSARAPCDYHARQRYETKSENTCRGTLFVRVLDRCCYCCYRAGRVISVPFENVPPLYNLSKYFFPIRRVDDVLSGPIARGATERHPRYYCTASYVRKK